MKQSLLIFWYQQESVMITYITSQWKTGNFHNWISFCIMIAFWWICESVYSPFWETLIRCEKTAVMQWNTEGKENNESSYFDCYCEKAFVHKCQHNGKSGNQFYFYFEKLEINAKHQNSYNRFVSLYNVIHMAKRWNKLSLSKKYS